MKSGIELSPKYGVNPAITVCFWCGKETGIALCGRIRNGKRGGDFESPIKVFCGYEPCPECQKNMKTGVTLMEASASPCFQGQHEIQNGVYPTGRWFVIKKDVAAEQLGCKSDKAFCDQQFFGNLLKQAKG